MADLTDFSRPNVAVDLVILTLQHGTDSSVPALGAVVLRRPDGALVLPGRFMRERTTVPQTIAALMQEKLGLSPRRSPGFLPLDVYDAPDRDPRGWVISLAHLTGVTASDLDRVDRPEVEVVQVRGSAVRGSRATAEPLDYDHGEMVTTAVRRTRRRYERSPDPLRLLRAPYTLTQLRHAHEAVLGTALKRDTFNRRMRDYLEPATDRRGENVLVAETSGRPAQMYQPLSRRRRDPEAGPFPLPRSQA